MKKEEISDINDFLRNQKQEECNGNIWIDTDTYKAECCNTEQGERWEKLFWKITDNEHVSNLLQGDIKCFFEWSKTDNEYDYDRFEDYYEKFKAKICKIYKENKVELYKKLLEYGDFYLLVGTGKGMQKYTIEIRGHINKSDDLRNILKSYIDDKKQQGDLYKLFVCGEDSVISYMEQFQYLKADKKVILLQNVNAYGYNYRALMVQWLWQKLKNSRVWQTNCVFQEFQIKTDAGKVEIVPETEMKYFYLDTIYNWNNGNPKWSFRLGTREKKQYHECIESYIRNYNYNGKKWEHIKQEQNKYYELKDVLEDDTGNCITCRINAVIDFINKEIWDKIKSSVK